MIHYHVSWELMIVFIVCFVFSLDLMYRWICYFQYDTSITFSICMDISHLVWYNSSTISGLCLWSISLVSVYSSFVE